MIPHIVTLSGPGVVRVEMHLDGDDQIHWTEATPLAAVGTAWAILDSARRALEKSGVHVPSEVLMALAAIAPIAKKVAGT